MSTTVKNTRATTKVVKPKVAGKKEADAPAPATTQPTAPVAAPTTAPVQQPAAQPANQPAAQPAAGGAAQPAEAHDESKAKRQQMTKAIGITISSARVRRWLDRLTLNKVVDEAMAPLKSSIAEYEQAKKLLDAGKVTEEKEEESTVDGKTVKTTKKVERDLTADERKKYQAVADRDGELAKSVNAKLDALSRARTRFSNEAPVVLSIICDLVVQELVKHAMDRVLAAKKKIIQVSHLHEAGVESLPLYPLVQSLQSFATEAKRLREQAAQEKLEWAVQHAREQAEKEFKRKFAAVLPKKKKGEKAADAPAAPAADAAAPAAANTPAADTPAAQPAAQQPAAQPVAATPADNDAEDDDEGEGDLKTTFRFYVAQACRELIKTNPVYAHVRVSSEIRAYLSDLLIELIRRLAILISLTTEAMKIKTVNDTAIMKTVEALLVDGHSPTEKVELTESLVPDPEAVKAELAKKTAEEAAGREYKVDLEKLPKVKGWSATKTVSYDGSGFPSLQKRVTEKLALYKQIYGSKAAEAVEEKKQ